ncbi:hypothetical protein JDV09_15580 [Mycobacterium sp. Y57]|uniref:hypothetical protein n=1 Tax=Mycolicibacterium xanthum TaxID=2796469 RepID=UPI001C850810|nr:hypothetical protein [Mycolicibacterium xanthum]MBX7433522.1 hypothetical protein [Mycolicibacterium xanthum]
MSDAVTLGLELATAVLAQDGPQQTGPDFGKASPFGLIIVVLLLIAVFGLVWSMNGHLKRLPKSFDADDDQSGGASGTDAQPDSESPRESG